MDTQNLIEVLAREVLKEIEKRENEKLSENNEVISKKSVITVFLGNDEVLKDELKNETSFMDNVKLDSTWEDVRQNENKKVLVVSTLGINDLIDLSQGRKSIMTEFLFNDSQVILVEEGLEYKKYTKPAALINLYDEYLEKVKEFGIKVVKRTEVKNIFCAKEKVYLKGLITESRLRKLGLKNQMLEVDAKSKVTSLAMDYIKENSITALVGESGSGKTTITNLLLRFYDVNQGSIKLGNIDIRDIPYDELLNRISIVMQNVQLFNNTIEENLRVGKKDANKEEIIEACKKSKIHDFIMSLPEQYETHIGENGGLLSGGQRQRISIARAFLKNAPILILDEMTSNVDPINESLIQEAITELAKDRTVLVIAHHLNTIQHADQILVFQKGKLLEKGKHQELLQKEGYYKKLWQVQDRA